MACPPQSRNGLFTAGREKPEKQQEQGAEGKSPAAPADIPRQ